MAMVELVIVLPLLLMLLFAIVELGLMFERWLTLNNAVREGAREAVLFRTPCNAGTVEAQARSKVVTYAQSGGISLALNDVEVKDACTGSGNATTVSATYDFKFQVLPGFADGFGADIPLAASATMRNE